MTVTTRYTCNLCNTQIEALKPGQAATGVGLLWSTTSKPDANILERGDGWINCHIHLCFKCIRGVAELNSNIRTA